MARACFVGCVLALGLAELPVLSLREPPLLPRSAVAAELPSKGAGVKNNVGIAGISTIGRCSGSAMMCAAPDTPTFKSHDGKGAGADAEHALLHEALDTIDHYFYDLKSDKGVAAAASAHTYNGADIAKLREAFDARKFVSRDATYKEIRNLVAKLGDKYSRFLPQKEAWSLQKYDVSGIGLVLISEDHKLFVAADPFPESPAALAGVARGDRVVSLLRGPLEDGEEREKVPLETLSANDAAALLDSEFRKVRTLGFRAVRAGVGAWGFGRRRVSVCTSAEIISYLASAPKP
jgi:hypothetical protein